MNLSPEQLDIIRDSLEDKLKLVSGMIGIHTIKRDKANCDGNQSDSYSDKWLRDSIAYGEARKTLLEETIQAINVMQTDQGTDP